MATFDVSIQPDYANESHADSHIPGESNRSRFTYALPGKHVKSWAYTYVKRAVDLVLGTMMLIVAMAPAILIAAAIYLTSRGPIFYCEQRVGRNGRLFRIWKFRSMTHVQTTETKVRVGHHGDQALLWRVHKSVDDVRITKIGHILRRWSLDELPQLMNVLRGEMSLIGPRPVIQAEISLYGDFRLCYLAAVPGLSGLWQVSGRSNMAFPGRAKLDAYYVQNWSLMADLSIFLRTIPAVLRRVGAR